MIIRIGTQTYLFNLNNVLFLFIGFCLLLFFVMIFAVIQNTADWGRGIRSNFYKVKIGILSFIQGNFPWDNPNLFSRFSNQAYFRRLNLIIYPNSISFPIYPNVSLFFDLLHFSVH